MSSVLVSEGEFQKSKGSYSVHEEDQQAVESLLQGLVNNREGYRIAERLLYSSLHKELCKEVMALRTDYIRDLEKQVDDLSIDVDTPESASKRLAILKWYLQVKSAMVQDELRMVFSELAKIETQLKEEYEQVLDQIRHPEIRRLASRQWAEVANSCDQVHDICSVL